MRGENIFLPVRDARRAPEDTANLRPTRDNPVEAFSPQAAYAAAVVKKY